MPRLDFEKQFAGQLKDRELKPSGKGWEKLQGRLEKEEKQRRPVFWWSGIAAAIVAGFIIFNSVKTGPDVGNSPQIVDTPSKEINKGSGAEDRATGEFSTGNNTDAVVNTSPIESDVPVGSGESEEEDHTEVAEIAKQDELKPAGGKGIQEEEILLQESQQNSAVASTETSGKGEITDQEINSLLAKAMSEVSEESPDALKVSDAQINALLAEAKEEIRKERTYETATVDAGMLLEEVETELEHSFREEVFELLKEGFRKTRTAVANRNN